MTIRGVSVNGCVLQVGGSLSVTHQPFSNFSTRLLPLLHLSLLLHTPLLLSLLLLLLLLVLPLLLLVQR